MSSNNEHSHFLGGQEDMRPESTIILIRSNDSPNKLISEKNVSHLHCHTVKLIVSFTESGEYERYFASKVYAW